MRLGLGYKLPFPSDIFTITAVVFPKAYNDHNFVQSEIVNLKKKKFNFTSPINNSVL
jgi:alpha-N-acetylglucosamine transferase